MWKRRRVLPLFSMGSGWTYLYQNAVLKTDSLTQNCKLQIPACRLQPACWWIQIHGCRQLSWCWGTQSQGCRQQISYFARQSGHRLWIHDCKLLRSQGWSLLQTSGDRPRSPWRKLQILEHRRQICSLSPFGTGSQWTTALCAGTHGHSARGVFGRKVKTSWVPLNFGFHCTFLNVNKQDDVWKRTGQT